MHEGEEFVKPFKSLLMLIWVFCGFLSSHASAKWLNVKDAPIESSYIRVINVNGDGTYEAIGEVNRKILTELGRTEASNITIYYNGDNEKIEVLEAKTIRNGKEYYLDKNLIEDKPLASSSGGFDQIRQILLAFPKTEVGAKLYLKYKLNSKRPLLENFFAETFRFGDDEINLNTSIKIVSKLPLHILVNDPNNVLKISEKKAPIYKLDIVLTKPIYNSVINEPKPSIVNEKHLTWVSVSTLDNWKKFATRYGALWTKVFTQKLPESFEQILKVAEKKDSEIDTINTITSLLNDKVRYMGDWRTIKGKFVARDLAQISKTQMGDCKDFSAATAAILAKLGFKVQIAVVMRGADKLSKNILPSFEAFNHAIIRVIGKHGQIYWIDPTNFESMAGGIFPDIANKTAVVLDPKNPDYTKIPDVSFIKAKRQLNRQWEIVGNDKFIETGELFLENENALGPTGGTLKASEDVIKNAVFYSLAEEKDLDEKNKKYVNLPRLDSRIVKNIFLDYSFERKDQILSTNVGSAFKLTYLAPISKIWNVSQDNVSDIFIDYHPCTRTRQTIIKNINVKNVESLNQEIKTPWLYVKRESHLKNGHDLQIDETIITYKNIIPNEDIHKKEFIYLRDWLERNFKNIAIVYSPA